jgi:hypothetical protein
MKALVTILAVALVLPAGAVARTDFRAPDQQEPMSGASRLPAIGTDVAAPDQQAPPSQPHVTIVRAPSQAASGFDWADAGVGAGGAVLLVSVSLGAALTLRRRQTPVAS